MSWGEPGRPKISTKLSSPEPREGSDGDIQIRQTNLGAKLFGKVGGTWYNAPLTGTAGDPVTKIGTNLSDHLSIDRNSIDVFTGGSKVATFGETTIIGDVGASKSNVEITSGAINLRTNTTNKITLDTDGNINLHGKIIVGKADGTFNANDNINIGQDQSGIGLQNICLGYKTGEDLTSTAVTNILIGYNAGLEVAGGGYNVCIGSTAGNTIVTGTYNICIGSSTDVDSSSGVERIAIGRSVECTADESLRIGDSGNNLFFDFSSSGGTIAVTSDERTKKNITNTDIGLDFINALKPIKFVGKNKYDYPDEFNVDKSDDRKPDPTRVQDGFIAQDVKKAMDDLDVTFSGWKEDDDTRQMLGYDVFVIPLTKAVQELSTKLDTMQTEINNLK